MMQQRNEDLINNDNAEEPATVVFSERKSYSFNHPAAASSIPYFAGAYVILFLTVSCLGGIGESRAFLNGSLDAFSYGWNGIKDLISLIIDSYTRMVQVTVQTIAEFFILLANGVGITNILVVATYAMIVIGFIYDREQVMTMANSLYHPAERSVRAIWKICSNPVDLMRYSIIWTLLAISFTILRSIAFSGGKSPVPLPQH